MFRYLHFPEGQGEIGALSCGVSCALLGAWCALGFISVCARKKKKKKRVRAALRLAQISAFLHVNVTGDAVISVFFMRSVCIH